MNGKLHIDYTYRVYAIKERVGVHKISDEKFIEIAENQGTIWSLEGFQAFLNCEGNQSLSDKTQMLKKFPIEFVKEHFFRYLHFRFITMEIKFESKTKELN